METERPNSNGSIMMGVCRGKISEGLDFKDARCRMVIMVGIPYPSLAEPNIVLKRYLLGRRFNTEGTYGLSSEGKHIKNITAGRWYEL